MTSRKKSPATQKPRPMAREELVARLREAEETLQAIGSGKVDAIVVSGPAGEKVFTLQGADHTYRVFVERMNEGAAILSSDHTVLHCNARFASLLGTRLQSAIGSFVWNFVWPSDHAELDALLRLGAKRNCRGEVRLRTQGGAPLPVRFSLNPLRLDGVRAVCLIASDLSDAKRAELELRASGEQLRSLAAHLLSIREEERTRISREIHDDLGQSLTAMKLDLAWLAAQMTGREGKVLRRIRSTLRLSDDLIQSVRRISTNLRPGVLDLGLAAALEWQVREFQARTGIQCNVRLLNEEVFAPEVSTALFRILQETLTNIARHAEATRVEVVKQKQWDRLLLRISDNGRGFDPENSSIAKSLGLMGMRERAAILGGQLNILSAPGKGTTVSAWIPLQPPQQSSAMP